MYNNAEQQNRDITKYSEIDSNFKLGKVTSVTAQHMPKVQINGASSSSTKTYPCVNSYWPQVNDIVLLAKQGLTYVVIGAIKDDALVAMWALADHNHDGTYSPADHNHDAAYATRTHTHDYSNTYAAKNHTHTGYAEATHTHSSIEDKSGSTTYGSINLNRSSGSISYSDVTASRVTTTSTSVKYGLIPGSVTQILGWSSNHWLAAYIDHIIAENVGSSSTPLQNIFSTYFMGDYIGISSRHLTSAYIDTVYGTVSSGSDRRIKKSIKSLGDKFREFFKMLKPVEFVYTDGSNDKTHMGFIAQDVEKALSDSGLDNMGVVTEDDSGIKHLNYSEFIALQTQAIQDLQERVSQLENKIKEMENDLK